ncbi:crotonobetaine/carnitine-CoA ligase [Tamaricihabitans halophyticus]|uniref:Crotonobetaine/carnitine-CoA ligase n=1 Tax=Tamaricihabitans halophyticus TaxID=1262583 RepID=A0A4R2QVN9_9PSEU|nr:AMP-binding protein [Tamaricihabitans halophyticus]TCP54142.1 crotonobetaine/carnitine-CoA ligase [Tamaricihabitans halophyticus]
MRSASPADGPPFELAAKDYVLSTVIERWTEHSPDRECAVSEDGTKLSYAQLNQRANALAAGLREHGIGSGDRVITLFADNGFRVVYAATALSKLGAVEVPVNPALVGSSLTQVLAEVEPRAAIVDSSLLDSLTAAVPSGTQLVTIVSSVAGGGATGEVSLDELLARPTGDVDTVASGSDTAAIMYTSGTTGLPKGAILPHRHLIRYGERTTTALGLTSADRLLTTLPLFHVGGRGMDLISCLLTGSCCVLIRRFSPGSFWQQARDHEATGFHIVLAMAHFILAQEPSPLDRDHRVSRGIIGPPTRDTADAFASRFGTATVGGYGSTEANLPMLNQDGPIDSMGRPTPPYRAWIVDQHDQPLRPGEVGELVVACDEPWSMFTGYWGRQRDTVEALRNFGFHTGDAAYADENGYLWFVDRIKDVIRRRGENISATQVESAVNAIDGVLESAAYAVPSAHGEDEVAVAIVRRPDVDLTATEIIRECADTLPRFAVPTYLRFVPELPKTATGKVRKVELKCQGIEDAEPVADGAK